MDRLHQHAHRVVWANPLLATPGYEPTARGMAAAVPHVDALIDGGTAGGRAAGLLDRMIHALDDRHGTPR
jgi:uncharacterized protein with von Willebrand factor type A (vWA) domain